MKCCDIHAGMMSTIITIERATPSSDGMGGITETWTADPSGGVYAYMTGLSGGEYWAAQRISPNNRYKAIIRYRDNGSGAPYYSAKDRVTANGRTYDIESVMDMEMKRDWLELRLVEGAAT